MSRKTLLAVAASMALAMQAGEALAWSCVASSSDGAQGWSSDYADEGAAEQRALRECQNVTTSYDCEVQQCVPDNGKS